jgi:hypothetical protein
MNSSKQVHTITNRVIACKSADRPIDMVFKFFIISEKKWLRCVTSDNLSKRQLTVCVYIYMCVLNY